MFSHEKRSGNGKLKDIANIISIVKDWRWEMTGHNMIEFSKIGNTTIY